MNVPIAYTFSPILHTLASSIDRHRLHILTIPLLPRKEVALRSQASEARILTALKHAHIPMTATELSRILITSPKRPHPMEQEALLYRQALSYIRNEWTGQSIPLTRSHIEILMHISLRHSFLRISRIMQANSKDIQRLLTYLASSNDHPILLAGITYAAIAHTNIHTFSQGRITLLLTSLIMAKTGYDIRGMMPLESSLMRDPKAYNHALSSITSYGQMTIWLEYFAQTILLSYTDLILHVETAKKQADKTSPTNLLNDRQKHILILLDTYNTTITNREVQKRFHISQITASRDLTTLVSAGYLSSRGKGRSVSYELA